MLFILRVPFAERTNHVFCRIFRPSPVALDVMKWIRSRDLPNQPPQVFNYMVLGTFADPGSARQGWPSYSEAKEALRFIYNERRATLPPVLSTPLEIDRASSWSKRSYTKVKNDQLRLFNG